MSDFDLRISVFQSSSLINLYQLRPQIDPAPPYQRDSDIWDSTKRQTFIDSLFNGFDIPKIYFHEFYPARKLNGRPVKYAIIDGKQRMQTVWAFMDDQFSLEANFDYYPDANVKLGGLTYSQIALKYPLVKDLFNAVQLPVYCILTDDLELIEDMFSRLNQAVPLNAAEKRNAFGAPGPKYIKMVAKEQFFTRNIPFKNSRFRHLDLACKFLYLTFKGGLPEDTKRRSLDDYIKSHPSESSLKMQCAKTQEILKAMSKVFDRKDELLKSVGTVTVYFLLFTEALRDHNLRKLTRAAFSKFEKLRQDNRARAEAELPGVDFDLISYDSLSQSPNDKSAFEFRLNVLRKHFL